MHDAIVIWHGGDGGWGWGAWLAMGLVMAIFWGVIAWVVVTLIRHGGWRPVARTLDHRSLDPMGTLDERVARGEIHDDEYQRRREVLRGST